MLRDFITKLHKSTARDYLGRMQDEKIHCMKVAKEYRFDYWDGDRRYGYGGYRYDGRWNSVAQDMADTYGLKDGAKILDVGCGKAYLLYEFTQVVNGAEVRGFDISEHGLADAKPEIRDRLFKHDARTKFPFEDNYFDLAISITTLHNFTLPELEVSVQEMERVAKQGYIAVEAYRSEEELFNLQCWALTCESFLRPEEWVWLYNKLGYTGDYEFIYF